MSRVLNLNSHTYRRNMMQQQQRLLGSGNGDRAIIGGLGRSGGKMFADSPSSFRYYSTSVEYLTGVATEERESSMPLSLWMVVVV